MKDLTSYKSTNRANIIPINRTTKSESSLVISAINEIISHFNFKNDKVKSESLGKLIYKINLLNISENELVFEIGTGTGIQAATLAAMGANVITISANKNLAQRTFSKLDSNIQDRIKVYSLEEIAAAGTQAPFDKITVAPEASNLPVELYALLSIGGKMLISNNDTENPTLLEVTRSSDETFDVKKKTGLKDKSTSYEVFDL